MDHLLNHECVIMQKTNSQDSAGGDAGSWSVVNGSNYFGYIGDISANERMYGGIEQLSVTNKHVYPVEVELTKLHRIKCITDPNGAFTNKIFEVLPLRNVWGHHKKAYLTMVV